ncbi:ferritin-like domain-containing protein, partial [Halorubrum sp. SP9]
DLIEAIEDSDAAFSIDRDELIATLTAIRDEEAEGVREVTEVMERR